MSYPSPEASAEKYIPGVDCPVWKMPRNYGGKTHPELLFDRSRDPGQNNDILNQNPAAREAMRELLRREMAAEGVPDEQYIRLMLK
jgi:hypothetical protein